jgi:hypothetical protein
MKLKLQDMTVESQSLARDQRMNHNTVGIFFNILEKVATEDNPSDKFENIFNIDKSGIHIYNKPDSVMTDKSAKNFRCLTSGGKIENITVMACCNAAGQYLPSVLIFKDANKKGEFRGGLHPILDVCMNRKSSYISTDFFFKSFTKHFLYTELQGRSLHIQMAIELIAALLFCVTLLLKITLLSFVYRITVLIPYSLRVSNFLDL